MELLGISISQASREEILDHVRDFLTEQKFHRIATVNPEFLVRAEYDAAFRQALLSADLCVADGIGIVLAGILHGKTITRFPGADLLHDVLSIAEKDGHGVFLAIKKDGLSSYEEIRTALLKKYPKLLISGKDDELGNIGNWKLEIENSAIVLCNYGAPMQELFLANLNNAGVASRLALGVGGSFDYLTGKLKRAPQCLRVVGLEWLWRLILQPNRFHRIFTATIIFPIKVLFPWQKSRKKL